MNIAVGLAFFLIASGVLLGIVPVQQWRGKLPPGDPHLITQRSYLLLPSCLALLIMALALLLGLAFGEGIVVALFTLGLVIGLVGLVLFLWGPKRLRPRWQKQYMAEMGYDGPEAQEAARRRLRGRS